MSDILMPKGPGMQGPKDAVLERLRRRVTGYRKHHDDCGPRFEHTINGLNDQQKQETLALRQRFLESKPKKTAKKSDKNKDGSNNSVTQKLQKRHCEGGDLGSGGNGGSDSYEPPAKMPACGSGVNGNMGSGCASSSLHHPGQSPSSQSHTGELSSGAGSMQKSLMKPASVPSVPPIHSPLSAGVNGPPSNSSSYSTSNSLNIEFKQEPAFADLDECAAALEKDATEGSIMSGLMGMGDDPNEGMINYDTLKDLISEISDNPDFMKDFDDFDDDHQSSKTHPGVTSTLPSTNHTQSTNVKSCPDSNSTSSFGSGLNNSHGGTPPVAPVTPTTTSPRLNMVKMESDGNVHSADSGCGNRGLSHCAGPSPAAASTASPLASQLNSHQPSQTPPYSSASAIFDSASPSGAQGQTTPLTPNSNPSYCPSSGTPTPHNPGVVGGINSKVTRVPYTSPGSLALDSPAAQTLKQMAEQHQHKAQLGMSTFKPNPASNSSPARSPFNGDSYGYSGSGEFAGGGSINVNSVSNSSNYSNVSVRTQSSGGVSSVSGVSDNMGMTMPIKQETNMYSHQTNFTSMDIKRSSVNSNHVRHSQPPPPTPPQHKISATNSARLPSSAMLQQQQQQQQQQAQQQQSQPPLYQSKSFSHGNSSGSQLGSSVSASVSASHMASSPHMQPFMSRSPNPGMSAVPPPNNYPPIGHSGYQGSPNHANVQLNQTQQIPIPQPNPAASLPVSTSGSQQMGASGDMKSTSMSASVQSQNFYYQNQGVPHSQMHHPQQQPQQPPQQPHQVVSQSQVSESAPPFMNNVQSNSTNPHMGGNNQGQTINFTQQHLRMSTGIPPSGPGMTRVMVPGPGPPGMGGPGGNMTRMGMPPRMPTNPGAAASMNDMNMGPRMELQHRMMRQQQIRGQSVPPQQMMRPSGPGDMMTQQQIMAAQGSMMNRFPNLASNPPSATGPGRPGMGPGPGGPGMMGPGGGPGQVPGPNMSGMRMQGGMGYGPGPGQGMSSVSGSNSNLPMGGNMVMGNVNMVMRHRMPSFNAGVGPSPSSGVPGRPGSGAVNHAMMMSSQSQQQSVGPSNDWVGMQDPSMRNYPGANMQQSHQNMRSNANPAGFHQGMPMQMTPQQQHAMSQMQRGDGSMCNAGVPGQPGMPGNQMDSMGYGQQKPQPQQQQMSMGGNPGNFPQMPPMGANKMSQSQQQQQNNACMTSNFTIKTGGGMAISNSTGSGGTMMCANSQSMNQICHTNNKMTAASNADMTNQDFNFDLLENITTGDASSFNSDTDFLNFDSNTSYNHILDSL